MKGSELTNLKVCVPDALGLAIFYYRRI